MPGLLLFLLTLAWVGALLIVFLAWVIALSLLHPPRMTDGKALYLLRRMSPGDLGLPFEPLTFDVADAQRGAANKIKLAAWWIPAAYPSVKTVVLLHGYADAKVGAIAWAPIWRELGFNVLAIDLRAHGESEGRHSTGGFFEQHDLAQALHQLRLSRPKETSHLVLMGISLGSAVALATANLRSDLADAVVLDSPFADFRNAATSHARRIGAPTKLVMPLALAIARRITGARFDEVQPLKLLRAVRMPVMIVQAEHDDFVGRTDSESIASVARDSPNITLWRAPACEHLLALAAHPAEYQQRLSEFVRTVLNGR